MHLMQKKNTENNQPARKLSMQERRESLFLYVEVSYFLSILFIIIFINLLVCYQFQTAGNVESAIRNYKEKLRVEHLTCQPLPVFVGNLLGIEAAYVLVNDVLYKADSSLKAIDLCFKISVALDCAYSKRALSLWIFIQKAVYDIHFDTDHCNRSVNALLGDVRSIIAANQRIEEDTTNEN